MAKSRIYIKPSKRGSLRRHLGTPKGKKIPASQLATKKGDSAAIRKKKVFARNARKWNRQDGGSLNDYYFVTSIQDNQLQLGGKIGSIAGSFLPIPGGSILGGMAGNFIENLIQGDQGSNEFEPQQLIKPVNPYINAPAQQPLQGGGRLTRYQGPAHEQGGMDIGPAEVEGGENEFNMVVNSDTRKIRRSDIRKFGIDHAGRVPIKDRHIGMTPAEVGEEIDNRYKKFYPYDPFLVSDKEYLGALSDMSEELADEMEIDEVPYLKRGGRWVPKKQDGGDLPTGETYDRLASLYPQYSKLREASYHHGMGENFDARSRLRDYQGRLTGKFAETYPDVPVREILSGSLSLDDPMTILNTPDIGEGYIDQYGDMKLQPKDIDQFLGDDAEDYWSLLGKYTPKGTKGKKETGRQKFGLRSMLMPRLRSDEEGGIGMGPYQFLESDDISEIVSQKQGGGEIEKASSTYVAPQPSPYDIENAESYDYRNLPGDVGTHLLVSPFQFRLPTQEEIDIGRGSEGWPGRTKMMRDAVMASAIDRGGLTVASKGLGVLSKAGKNIAKRSSIKKLANNKTAASVNTKMRKENISIKDSDVPTYYDPNTGKTITTPTDYPNIYTGQKKARNEMMEKLSKLNPDDITVKPWQKFEKEGTNYLYGDVYPDKVSDNMFGMNENLYDMKLRKNKMGGSLTSTKAKQMLRDNQAQGKPLSPRQKRFFGWVAGGRKQQGGGLFRDPEGQFKPGSALGLAPIASNLLQYGLELGRPDKQFDYPTIGTDEFVPLDPTQTIARATEGFGTAMEGLRRSGELTPAAMIQLATEEGKVTGDITDKFNLQNVQGRNRRAYINMMSRKFNAMQKTREQIDESATRGASLGRRSAFLSAAGTGLGQVGRDINLFGAQERGIGRYYDFMERAFPNYFGEGDPLSEEDLLSEEELEYDLYG